MAKYNWRTHIWKVGDRLVSRARGQTKDIWRGTVIEIMSDRLYVKYDNGYNGKPPYAQCVPLRKKPKVEPRTWWLAVYKGNPSREDYVFGKRYLGEVQLNAHPGAEFVKVMEITL